MTRGAVLLRVAPGVIAGDAAGGGIDVLERQFLAVARQLLFAYHVVVIALHAVADLVTEHRRDLAV